MTHHLEIDSDEALAHAAPPKRHFPLKPALAVIALAAFAGGSWWVYRSEKPRLPLWAVPVIHSDAAPVKEAPKNPGGMVVPDQDSVLLNREGKGNPRVEQLLPAAEPVLPRPAAPPKPAPQIDAAVPVKPVPVKEASPPVAAKPEPAPIAPPPAPQVPLVTQTAAPPAVAVAPPISPAASTAIANAPVAGASGAAYRLQLGAVRSEEAAKQEWEKLKRAQPDLLGKLSLTTSRADLGDKGIYYRIQAGPIADAAVATQSCATLKSRNVGCILVKP